MASAPPLMGGGGGRGGGGNDGSREKHRWSDSGKVYTRKSFNKTSKSSLNLNPQTLTLPPPSTTAATTTTTTIHFSSDDSTTSSTLIHRPHATVTISLAFRNRHEARDLRRQLTAELRQVRALANKFNSIDNRNTIPSQLSVTDVTMTTMTTTPVVLNSDAWSTPPVRSQLSVSVPENSVGEKEKRTPKANQYYRNSEFLLGKERLNIPDSHKKSKSMVDTKLYAQAFRSCSSLLLKIMKHKHGWVFNTPVDVKALGLHDYFTIIKHPMDLGTVKSRLSKNRYKNPAEFGEDVRLTFRNAMTYNPKGQDVHFMAEQLLQIFEEEWPAIEAEYTYISTLKRPVSAKRPPPINMRKVLERSDSTMNPLSVESKTKPASFTPHVGGPPTVLKKPKAKDLNKRDMTFEEKKKLSSNLENLPPEKLDNIVQIIKKRNSSLSQHDDEIEVDIDSVDTETLWELDRFVVNYKKSLSKNKRKAELAVHGVVSTHHDSGGQERVQERNSDPVVAEVPKESRTVVGEKDMVSLPREAENKGDNASRSGTSSSSSSDSGSSSSDSDSESSSAGSDMAQSPRR